jgi:glutathione synthase/RimK-type ligase-like ATP-grasp enzyme
MKQVAFATYQGLPNLTQEDRMVCEALLSHGVLVQPAVWDDPEVRWEAFDAVIVRSTWDYHLRCEAFRAWIDRVEASGVPLWNPAPLLRWNLEKSYLRTLEERGVPIIPTIWLSPGESADLPALLDRHGWEQAVVKPSISASAFGTWRTSRETAAADQERLAALLDRGGALIQPFLPEICQAGEWSFIFLGGSFSHAVRKRPRPGDFRVQSDFGGTAAAELPPPFLLEVAERVVAAVEQPWLYARVDGVEVGGKFLLMELEMTEPALFLSTSPHAVARFAQAIKAKLS